MRMPWVGGLEVNPLRIMFARPPAISGPMGKGPMPCMKFAAVNSDVLLGEVRTRRVMMPLLMGGCYRRPNVGVNVVEGPCSKKDETGSIACGIRRVLRRQDADKLRMIMSSVLIRHKT